MKKLFYTLFLALFALNFVSAQQYTAYFRFTTAPESIDFENVSYEIKQVSRRGPYVVVVKHQGDGWIEITASQFVSVDFTPEENITYINGKKYTEGPVQMYDFYVYSNIDIIEKITPNIAANKQYHFDEFIKLDNDDFEYAYKSRYNYTAFGNAYIGYDTDGDGTCDLNTIIANSGDIFHVNETDIEKFENISYTNNDTEDIKYSNITGTITNSVTNYNINYFQWVSCPYNAELSIHVGGREAVYNDANDDGTEPAFLLMKYKNDEVENPWVDNSSANLIKGVGYILAIDNRGVSGSVIAEYISTNNINRIEKTFSHTLSENDGISSDRTDANVHLIGTGLFDKPTGCSFENARFMMFAIPNANGNSYTYVWNDKFNSSSLTSLTPHSAFFAQTAGNLTFNMTGTITQNAPSLKRAMEQQIVVEEYNLTLTGTDFEEKTTILTDELGTEGYTIGEDFIYLHSTPNGDVQNKFYSFDANRTLSFNHRANTTQTIRLGGQVAQDGRYTISLDGVNTKATSVILTDNVENTFVDLINENYTFDANKGSISGRFTVTINYAPNTTVDTDVVTNSNGIVVVNNFEGCTIENLVAGEQMMIFDAMGRLVYNAPADANSVNLTLSAGTYIVRQNNNWAKFVIR